jgi:hypothetical protein
MSKEQQELLDGVYVYYCKSFENQTLIEEYSFDTDPMTQFMFINKCKTDQVFSEKWGLTIEQRELRQFERVKLLHKAWKNNGITPEHKEVSTLWVEYKNLMEKYSIPTRLITVTYNDKTTESYE